MMPRTRQNIGQRTAANNLHLSGGQGVVGSNPASPTETAICRVALAMVETCFGGDEVEKHSLLDWH